MKRKALAELVKWKKSPDRQPLILQGARQVGKTWLVKEFGRLYFPRTAYFDFEKSPELKDIFSPNLDVDRILELLSSAAGFKLTSDTLVIFDEIQECPRAITSLKYFCEDKPDFHVIAAGSLLGITLHSGLSFPVGRVSFLTLYPLNFYEFLDAVGKPLMVEQLEKGNVAQMKPFHEELLFQLKKYIFIGGMPAVVSNFVKEHDFQKVRRIQNKILTSYTEDFSKHIPKPELSRALMVWNSIPGQLAKENKKFFYSAIKKGARSKEFEKAILWLESCGLIHKVHRVKKPALPLNAYKDLAAFKLFMVDVGLMSAMASLGASALLEKNEFFAEFKGALTEQYVLQQLLAVRSFKDLEITYWSTENNTNDVDFVVQTDNEVLPIEVKSSINLRSKSLAWYIEKFHPCHAVRFSAANYKQNEVITVCPLYAVSPFFDKKDSNDNKYLPTIST